MFRTKINIKPSPHKINIDEPIISLGSCFANTIGDRLQEHKFNVLSNPFGVIYNPIAISQLLIQAITQALPHEDSFIERQHVWYNLYAHSDISGGSRKEITAEYQAWINLMHDALKTAKHLIITWGTAFSYDHTSTGILVGNCHKLPAKQFTKRLLSTHEINATYTQLFTLLKELNPELQITLTLSPVRHIKDDLEQNSISKSILRVAINDLCQNHSIQYFPSYEILLDELRDYRFFDTDMVHPNTTAQNYIWEGFANAYLSEDAQAFLKKWSKIKHALEHRSFHPETPEHQTFLTNTLKQLQAIKENIDLSEEIELIQQQIIS